MRTETLAIVFTDIKGYTAATSAQTHVENAHMLKRVERLIEPVVRAYSGRVIKSIGDAYMIVFRSPTEAVRCATAIQDRLHQHNTSVPTDKATHIRIAMNLGEVRVHRGDVFGEPVNIAARIEGVTPADEIYISEAVYLTMNKSSLPTEKVGEFELKGIPHPVTVFRMKKFASEGGDADTKAAGLPFGGTQLSHWNRMKYVRGAYMALWAMAVIGLLGAAYLRYRPTADYTQVLTAMKDAVQEGKPMNVLALAGQIPGEATQERSVSRRYRRQAVAMLLETRDLDSATTEINSLLNDDGRDAEALVLKATLLAKRGNDVKGMLDALSAALKINPPLASRADVVQMVVSGYRDGNTRRAADNLLETYVRTNGIAALNRALTDASFDRASRVAIGLRLEKLGAAEDVDWVALALEDLKSTACKTRKNAIGRLVTEGDERAVGPLLKLADAGGCGASQAKKAVETILGK